MSSRGERLKYAIEARGIDKQLALAFELGVHQSAITRWKEGGPISLANAMRLCAVLDISMDWLLLARGAFDQHKQAMPTGEVSPLDDLERFERATAQLPKDIVNRFLDLMEAVIGAG